MRVITRKGGRARNVARDRIIGRITELHENPNSSLPDNRLPSAYDILSYYFFLSSSATLFATENFYGVACVIAEELRAIWQRCLPGLPLQPEE